MKFLFSFAFVFSAATAFAKPPVVLKTDEEISNEMRRKDMIRALEKYIPSRNPDFDMSFTSPCLDEVPVPGALCQIDIHPVGYHPESAEPQTSLLIESDGVDSNELHLTPIQNPSDFYHIWNVDFYKVAWEDTVQVATAPARWDLSDWAVVGVVAGGTGLLLLVDDDVRSWAESTQNPTLDVIADIGNAFGDGKVMLPVYGATYLAGELTQDVRLRRVSMLALESFLLSGAITQVGKIVTQRQRPDEAENQYDFWVDGFNMNNDSFPSGHTTVAFSTATVVSMEYQKDYPWVPVVAYGLASTTAFARIYDDHHWASDVFMGAAIGTAVGWLISEMQHERMQHGNQVMVTPYYDGHYYGVRVGIEF